MRPPRSIMTEVFRGDWLRERRRRRIGVAVVALILVLLTVWPRHYEARAQLLPNDTGSGLTAFLSSASGGAGGLLSLGALIGNHQSIEADLTISRSQAVIRKVARLLRQNRMNRTDNEAQIEVALRKKADIQAIRGSIVQISVDDKDPVYARDVVSFFVTAIRERLTEIALAQSALKKAIATERLNASSIALAQAQGAIDRFRLANHLAAPEIELGSSISLITDLQAQLHAQQTQLSILLKFATPDNVQVQSAQAQIAALQGQIANAEEKAKSTGPSVGQIAPKISEYENLFRDEKYAEAEYQVYRRYLDSAITEALSAHINMDIIEPPFVTPERQFNVPAIGALLLLIFFAIIAEYYIATSPPPRAARA